MEIRNGTRLGPYEITGIIAAGGMGEVFRARDTRLGRDVAVKVLPQRFSADASLRERLHREARVVSSLAHPHICTLFDVGDQDGADYLVMEYLEGDTLAEKIERGPLPLHDVARYGSEIADAIAAAHRSGVVHRDLKPGNVMLTRSGTKVLDFGLATATAGDPSSRTVERPLTRTGHIVGTLQYMSPEQLRGDPVDARADIYALGLVLYEMATGRRAHESISREALLRVEPPALDAIVRRCTAADPEERYQSARDVALALQELGRSKPRGRPLLFAAAAAIAVATAAIVVFAVLRTRSAAAAPRPNTIAVLPFANLGVDPAHDYLRLAIPDEVTTILTYNPDLAVRPFSASRQLDPNLDPQVAAKRLNAAAIVSGHVMNASGRLDVTLEATDVHDDRLLWRDRFDVATSDVVTMRNELGARIQRGLMPRLAGTSMAAGAAAPKNRDAYVLFLRAAALPDEGEPNIEAVRLLEQAIALEPDYANAWAAISLREYYAAAYGAGGKAAKNAALEAAQRALQLDPDSTLAASQEIVLHAERGDTIAAYRSARRLLDRRPRSGDAHFNLAYTLRYGGALEESARECNIALALDPGNRQFRSCMITFDRLHDERRAADFAKLDPGSTLVRRTLATEALRRNDPGEALRMDIPSVTALVTSWRAGDQSALQRATDAAVGRVTRSDDGEGFYAMAGTVAFVGRYDAAIALLQTANAKNFCFYPAVDGDPLYAGLRSRRDFAAVRGAAVQCHERFMAAMRE